MIYTLNCSKNLTQMMLSAVPIQGTPTHRQKQQIRFEDKLKLNAILFCLVSPRRNDPNVHGHGLLSLENICYE